MYTQKEPKFALDKNGENLEEFKKISKILTNFCRKSEFSPFWKQHWLNHVNYEAQDLTTELY